MVGVEIEPDMHLLAIDTKVAFTAASLLLSMAKVTDMAPAALMRLYHNLAIDRSKPGMACCRCARQRAADQGQILLVA
jgi:hypothetical protein